MVFGRLEFAAVFAQLRRNKIEIERAIQVPFHPRTAEFSAVRLFSPGPLLWIGRQRRKPIFIQGPTAFQRAAAHLDVVLLAAGKVIERERIFGRADHAQIALNAGAQSHARFGRALRDDRFDQRMLDKKFRDRVRLLGRHDEIEIAHDFFAPPITSGKIDMQRIGMRGQIGPQRLGFGRRSGQAETNQRAARVRRSHDKFFPASFLQNPAVPRRGRTRTLSATARSS